MQFFKNILQNEELRMQLACIVTSGAALLASMLANSAAPEVTMHASCILNSSFCNIFLKNCIFTASFYTHRGIGICIYNILPAKCNVNKKHI